MNDGSLTRLAREHARGLLTEAAEEARELARADLVDQLRRAWNAACTPTPSPIAPTSTSPSSTAPVTGCVASARKASRWSSRTWR